MTKFWIERKTEVMTIFEGEPERIATVATAHWRSDREKTRRLRTFAETQVILLCEAPTILRAIWGRGKTLLHIGDGCQLCYGHYSGTGYVHDDNCQWPALDAAITKARGEQCES